MWAEQPLFYKLMTGKQNHIAQWDDRAASPWAHILRKSSFNCFCKNYCHLLWQRNEYFCAACCGIWHKLANVCPPTQLLSLLGKVMFPPTAKAKPEEAKRWSTADAESTETRLRTESQSGTRKLTSFCYALMKVQKETSRKKTFNTDCSRTTGNYTS